MAGEWLKFEANTPEKPEVFSITVAMGWDDPDLTVGKLLKVWRWFDQQTIDGNAPRVTLSLLDRISGVSGFAQAMCDVGWLVCSDAGLSLPNFDRHNGKTAKDRCLTAKRVAKHKSNAGGNGAGVTPALPRVREEKNREEEPKTIGAGALDVALETDPEKLAAIEVELAKHNGEPTAKVPKRAGKPEHELPDWLPLGAWSAFMAMRKKIRKPLADEAVPLAIGKLEKLRAAGHDPEAVLNQSTLNSWQGLFEVRDGARQQARPAGRPSMNDFGHAGVDDDSDPFNDFRRA